MILKKAIITGMTLTRSESAIHQILYGWVNLSYHDGNFDCLDSSQFLPEGFGSCEVEEPNLYARHFVRRIKDITGVKFMEDLIRTSIRVLLDGNSIIAIGHHENENWFFPAQEFKEL